MTKEDRATEAFKKAIETGLQEIAAKDPLFAPKLTNPKKNIDDCCQYIMHTVKESGRYMFTEPEVYAIAVHYYDEEEIDIGKPMKCFVVNSKVEFTEEDKKDAKEKAMQELINQEKQRMAKKPEVKKPAAKPSAEPQGTLF